MCGFVFASAKQMAKSDFQRGFDTIFHRGPDHQSVTQEKSGLWGFHRLSIMDLSANGNQPFVYDGVEVICNGEVYNFEELRELLKSTYDFKSDSDCEVLIPLYQRVGFENMMKMLDAECALVLFDGKTGEVMAGRDPIGIRPMFYGYEKESGSIAFASEAKVLMEFCRDIQPFPPGHIYQNGEFICFNDIADPKVIIDEDVDTIAKNLKEKLEKG